MTTPRESGEVAPDGSPVEAFALLPPGPAPDIIDGAIGPGSTILDLGSGAGRLAHPLMARGHTVCCVDQSAAMLAHVHGAEAILADIEDLDLGRTFDAVLLSSNLINTPYVDQRAAFLETCARHIALGGCVLVQRLDPELVPEAIDAESTADGVTYSLAAVEHVGDLFVATVGFTIGDEHWVHRYRGEVLDDHAVEVALAKAGLAVDGYLDGQRTWIKAVLA
jgi:SAM-dependent methyltransferase